MMKKQLLRRGVLLFLGWGLPLWSAPAVPEPTLYSFSLVKPDGATLPLSSYKGKVVVIVNLASRSSFADQLPALQKLSQDEQAHGLVVLGVPSNDFGAEEPDNDAELAKSYAAQHVTFPILAKSSVCGKDELPLYAFLTTDTKHAEPKSTESNDALKNKDDGQNQVHWSYTKFIVTREGHVGARFEPDVAPDSPEFQIAIQKALAGKLKPGGEKPSGEASPEGGDMDAGT